MLKAIGWTVKTLLFAALVLILGNYLKVGGRTVSDQVKTQLSHADEVKSWAKKVTREASEGFRKEKSQLKALPKLQHEREGNHESSNELKASTPPVAAQESEDYPASERQKLKDLIRELNTSRRQN